MQTEQQRLQIFSHGRHILICLCFVLTATLCPAQMLEVDINPPDTKKILDREKCILEEPSLAEPSPLLLEREQILLAESEKPIAASIDTKQIIEAPEIDSTLPTCNGFNFPPERKFLSNPLTAEDTTLPPLPYQLTPMGNPPPRKKQPTVHKPLVIKPAPPTPQEIAKKEAEEKEIEKHKNDLLALSPFLEWVRQNKEKAVEIAQESAQQYKKEAPKPSDDDLFLSIRFPYKGTEPSGNSVAIYSTPEK